MSGTQTAEYESEESYVPPVVADDPTLTVDPATVRRNNPGVPDIDLFARPKSDLDRMVERMPAVAKERADITRQQIASGDAIRARMDTRTEEDRARMTRAYDAMGVEAEKLQPWDADKAREKFRTDPLESFGSLGSVFAMLASAFTHAPMTNALNASAAAMHAIKDGNDEQFKRAFEAFKENNDLVVKRHAMMNQQYHNAATLMDKDMAAGRDALAQNAARFGDQRLLTLLNAGFDKEALEYVSSFTKMYKDQEDLKDHLTERAYMNQNFKMGLEQIRKEWGHDPQQYAARTLAWYRHTYDKKETKPSDAAFGLWLSTKGLTADPDEVMAKAHEFDRRARASVDLYIAETAQKLETENLAKGMSPGEASRDALARATQAGSKMGARPSAQHQLLSDKALAELKADFGEVPPVVENMIRQAYEAKGTTAPLHLAQVAEAIETLREMKAKGEDVTPEKISTVMAHAFSVKPNLTSEGLKYRVELFKKGNPEWKTGGGTKAQIAANSQAVMDAAFESFMDVDKLTPEEAAQKVNRMTLEMIAFKRGAGNLGTRMSTTYSAAELALSTADRVTEASDKINRTRFPSVNSMLLSGKEAIGNEDVVEYKIAIDTLAREYARAAVGGNNQLTDSAQNHAREQLYMAYSKGQIKAAVRQMKKELDDMKRGATKSLVDWGQDSELFRRKNPGADKPQVDPAAKLLVPFKNKIEQGASPPGLPPISDPSSRAGLPGGAPPGMSGPGALVPTNIPGVKVWQPSASPTPTPEPGPPLGEPGQSPGP